MSKDNTLHNIQTTEGIISIDNNVQMHTLLGGDNPLDNKLQCHPNKGLSYIAEEEQCNSHFDGETGTPRRMVRRVRKGLTTAWNGTLVSVFIVVSKSCKLCGK
jgi:hypothetical protein